MQKRFVLQKVYFMPLHVSSTVVFIIRRSNLYYTASGIVTLKVAVPCTGQLPTRVMIPEAV